MLMVFPYLPVVVIGLILFTVAYFATHSVANGQVSRQAKTRKSQASTLYFVSYYIGGTVLGWAGGIAWAHLAWSGVTALLIGAITLTFIFRLGTQLRLPLAEARPESAVIVAGEDSPPTFSSLLFHSRLNNQKECARP